MAAMTTPDSFGAHSTDSFGAHSTITVGEEAYEIYRLSVLESRYDIKRLPYTLRILLENVLRLEDGINVTAEDVEAVAEWTALDKPSREISFTPARVLLQDFTGVPAIVDLAAMRDAMQSLGGDPRRINPSLPAELVIDHSVQVDEFATPFAFARNTELEFERNRERYAFLRWGQRAFDNLKVVPPGTGIVHQVNLEYLARVVETREGRVFPDTLVGTDSHTTMINGLGVLGWGVGGIEAEAAMLGEPLSMLVPQVVGFRLTGSLPDGATATDLVLTVTQILRELGVVGKFVEYFGRGCWGCRSRIVQPSETCPRSTGQRVASSRSTRRRCGTSALPGGASSRSISSSPIHVSKAFSMTPILSRVTPRLSSSISRTLSRVSRDRGVRKIGFLLEARRSRSFGRYRALESNTGTVTITTLPRRFRRAIRRSTLNLAGTHMTGRSALRPAVPVAPHHERL